MDELYLITMKLSRLLSIIDGCVVITEQLIFVMRFLDLRSELNVMIQFFIHEMIFICEFNCQMITLL